MSEQKEHLDPGPLMLAEFNYIAQTAFQANEDRARATSFYLVTFGSFIAALLSAQTDLITNTMVRWGFALLFFAIAGLGYSTLTQLAHLRRAWFSSVDAMNEIKKRYLEKVSDQSIRQAFLWMPDQKPARFKINSVAFAMAFEVSLVSAVTLGTALYFALAALGADGWILPGILAGAAFLAFEIDRYRKLVQE